MKKPGIGVLTTFIVILVFLGVGVVASILSDMISAQAKKTSEEAQADKVTLSFVYAYQNQEWAEAISESVLRFEEEYPDIIIDAKPQYENITYDATLCKLYARAELGDIVQMKTPFYYAECGALGAITKDVYDDVKEDARYVKDGAVFGLSAVATTTGVIYNKALFDRYGLEEPKTYDEFLELCETLKNNGETPLLFAGADFWHSEYLLNHFMHTGDTIDEAADKIGYLIKKGYVNPEWQTTYDGQIAYSMSQGKAAMVCTGCTTVKELLDQAPDYDFGWFYLPDRDGNVTITDTKDAFLCITRECELDEQRYQAAETFLKFFYSDENYTQVLKKLYAISVTSFETDTLGDGIYEDIADGYSSNKRKTSYLGDETYEQQYETEMLRKIHEQLVEVADERR